MVRLERARGNVGVTMEAGQVRSVKFLAPLAGFFMLEVRLGYKSRPVCQFTPRLSLVG